MSTQSRRTWTVVIVAVALLLLRSDGQSTPTQPDDSDLIKVTFDGAFGLFVDESGERSPKVATALGSLESRVALDNAFQQWRHWDGDTTANNAMPQLSELLQIAKFRMPCSIFADKGYATIRKMPQSRDELLALLQDWEGKQ